MQQSRSEAKFVVTFSHEGGKEEVIPIYPGDHELKKFRGFNLTEESLESKHALECFLQAQFE